MKYPFEIGATVVLADGADGDMMRKAFPQFTGEVFMVESYLAEDKSNSHVMLKCITDPKINIDGYFHTYNFKHAL